MEDDTGPQQARDDALTEQLNQTTSPDAGGTVSGTRDDAPAPHPEMLDIVFEPEEDEDGGH